MENLKKNAVSFSCIFVPLVPTIC